MRFTLGQLRRIIKEELEGQTDNEPEFSVVPGKIHKGAWRVHTPQDHATRDIVAVRHPNGDVQAYFQSSGRSGGGYKGAWIPFEGWSTSNRVPKGGTFDDLDADEDIQFFTPGSTYGDNAIMAKTYWNVGSAKAPPGTIHDEASRWITDWVEGQGGLNLPTMTISDNIRQLGGMNRWLYRVGAIDRSVSVLNVSNSRGRRLQFGLDKVS